MTERLLPVGGATLCVETFGDADDPTILLIAGAAASMDLWEPGFCARLADAGRFVIRYDHRDTGRSTVCPAGQPSYTFRELVTDPLGVLDALGISRAHLVGMSMGGGIAQHIAVDHRDRVRTLTLIATSAGGERADATPLPGMSPALVRAFEHPLPAPDWGDPAAAADHLVEIERLYAGTLGFDEERARRRAAVVVGRTRDLAASVTNHWVLEGGPEPFRMADIDVPTLVLHGTADPFFPLAHGEALAAEIPAATLVPLVGMGHEAPPPALWDVVVPAIAAHTATADAAAAGP